MVATVRGSKNTPEMLPRQVERRNDRGSLRLGSTRSRIGLIRASSSRGYREISTVGASIAMFICAGQLGIMSEDRNRTRRWESECRREVAAPPSTGIVPWLITDGLSGGIFPGAGAGKRGGLENRGSGFEALRFRLPEPTAFVFLLWVVCCRIA